MYDRAPRNCTYSKGSTTVQVGPGTYDTDLPPASKNRADGYAPFLSMTGRETFLNNSDQVIAAPGPGQYDPSLPQNEIKGGKTMGNRSKRFDKVVSHTPGPGAYNLSKKEDWLKEAGRSLSAPGQLSPRNKSSALTTSRIKFLRKPDAASIPSPGQAYGYEENEDGTLKKQGVPERDISMGPAYYNVANEQTKTTKAYKGVHFSKYASKRMDFGGRNGPGPGEYEPYKEPTAQVEHANIVEKKKVESKLPRYHEWVVQTEEKKAVPGPGKYQVPGTFDPKPTKVNTEGIEVEHPPFGSQAKRFGLSKSGNPAPGTYNDPRSALDGLKKVTGLKRSPFGQTSVRFPKEHHVKKTPGPGQYCDTGMGADSIRKAYLDSTRRGVFGTTSVRIQPMTKRTEVELPGPAHYQVPEKVHTPKYQQLSANFASLSTRLHEAPTVIKEVPPPGSYNVDEAFSRSQGKRTTGNPRSEDAKRKQGAFLSSSSRFAPPRDVVLNSVDSTNPDDAKQRLSSTSVGPGTYKNTEGIAKKGGLMVTKDRRFKDAKLDGPGPGAYEFSPLIQDTVLRGTFNATLNNPVAPQLEGGVRAGSSSKHAFLLGV